MRKFVLGCFIVTTVAAFSAAQTNSVVLGATVSNDGPVGAIATKVDDVLQVPLMYLNTVSSGLQIASAPRGPVVQRGQKNLVVADQPWNVFVAQVDGQWFEFDKAEVPFQLAVYRTPLSSFAPTLQATDFGTGHIPVNAAVNVTVSVKAVTAVAGAKNGSSVRTTLDPLSTDGQTVYLMSSDLTQGVQLTFTGGYDFEASSAILAPYDLATVRTSLTYWAMFGPDNATADKAVVPHLSDTLVASLANSATRDTLLAQVLELLVSQLEITTSYINGKAVQTWGFPTARMYQALARNLPEYRDAFFAILDAKQLLSFSSDSIGAKALNQTDGALFSERSLDYLKAAALSPKTTAVLNWSHSQADAQGQWLPTTDPADTVHSYHPADPLDLVLDQTHLNQVTPAIGLPSATIAMTIPPQDPGSTVQFQAPIVFFPPGPNLVTSANLNNYAAVEALELPVSASGASQGVSNVISLHFSTPQDIESLLFWLKADTAISSISASLSGTPVELPGPTIPTLMKMTALPGEGISTLQLTVQSSLTTANGLAVVDWGKRVTVDTITITLASGSVLNLRAYSQKTTLDAGLTYSATPDQILVTSKVADTPPELFSAASGNDVPYFLTLGSTAVSRGGADSQPTYSPVWYAAGGLDTPLSFNIKKANNLFWKSEFRVKSLFPLTEFDLNRALRVDSSFAYADSQAMPTAGPIVLPGSLPVPLPSTATSWGSFMYPYMFGVLPSTGSGAVTNPSSPLYVEKMAGVDGPGMVLSLLKALGWVTRTDGFVQTRYASRVNLSTYDQIRGGLPWQSYGTSTSYLTGPRWFLDNSYVLTDWTRCRPGDILVGYEGSELSVAIIVGVDESDTDPMHRVSVVTINRATLRATYARWSSMSLNPQNYHIRRLVIQDKSPQGVVSTDVSPSASTGFLSFPANFTVKYAFNRTDPDHFMPWIPNTGELAYLGKIQPSVGGVAAAATLFNDAKWSIGPNSVQDYGFSAQPLGGNITNNSSKTVFYLVALQAPHVEDGISVLLSTPSTQGGAANYFVDPSASHPGFVVAYRFVPGSLPGSPYFSVEANPNLAAWSHTIVDGNLALIGPGNVPYEYFALVATTADGGAPIPGDDLQMGVVVEAGLPASTGPVVISPDSGPRLAVYDKKMLWRANLYIDEGNNDWNNLHPWITDNEWNRYFDVNSTANKLVDIPFVTKENTPAGIIPGGQVLSIPEVTSPIDGVPASSAVTYDYPENTQGNEANDSPRSFETPFQYAIDIAALRAALKPAFDAAGNPVNNQLGNYNSSTAPKKQWLNYWQVVLKSNVVAPGVGLLWGSIYDGVQFNPQAGLDAGTIKQMKGNSPEWNNPKWAGVDCVGLAKSAALYTGSPYAWTQTSVRSYPDTAVNGVAVITNKDLHDGAGNYPLLKYAIPGDVMYYYSGGVEAHIAIVLSNDESGSTDKAGLIESTHNGLIANVADTRTLSKIVGQTWVIARLR